MRNAADVLILGGGLVGSALATALDRSGIVSIVVDPADPAVMLGAGFDGRASAVASASRQAGRQERCEAGGGSQYVASPCVRL